MKKNKMMRLASALLVAVLLTTSVISGTYAKYVTEGSGSDTARVARWGVELTISSTVFSKTYAGTDDVTVLADENVIAPGTSGTAATFTIGGTPEVDVNLVVTLDGKDGEQDDSKVVKLAAGDHLDYTTALDTTDKFNLAKEYIPVKWTLTKDGNAVYDGETKLENVSLETINSYFNNTTSGLSGDYNVEEQEGLRNFDDVTGEYVLTWTWPFSQNDKADTFLGNEPTLQKETFTLRICATQID